MDAKLFLVKEKENSFLKELFEYFQNQNLNVKCTDKNVLLEELKKEKSVNILIFEPSSFDFDLAREIIALNSETFFFLALENNEEIEFLPKTYEGLKDPPFDLLFSFYPKKLILSKIKSAYEKIISSKELQKLKLFEQIISVSLASSTLWDLNSFYKVFLSQLEKCFCICIGVIFEFNESKKSFKVKSLSSNGEEKLKKLGVRWENLEALRDKYSNKTSSIKSLSLKELKLEPSQILYQKGFKSIIVIPLKFKDKLFGSFMLLTEEKLSKRDLFLLEHLCQVVSFITNHIYLFERYNTLSKEIEKMQKTTSHQERLRILGEMASGIAHDLNNVVTPLIGFSQLLLERESHLSNRGKQYLHHIIKAGEEIKNIVSRLRQFYRKKDELDEEFTFIDINKIILEAVEFTKPKWKDISQEKGINIEIDLQLSSITEPIKGNPSEIREVLINLIINSVDALPDGGKITISSKIQSDNIVVEIKDEGIGMDKYTLEHCIDPFFTTKGKEGSGLGLSIIYGIMQRHDGKMEIKSEKGKGTTVTLYFPISKSQKKKENHNKINKQIDVPKLWILHIDDDRAVLRVVKDMLEKDGHRVVMSSEPQKAIEIFKEKLDKQEPFDLVITDLGMPNMEGKKVASMIKALSPETPVILLSGWDIIEKDLRSINIDYVLEKPISFYDLRKAIIDLFLKGAFRRKYVKDSFSIESKGR